LREKTKRREATKVIRKIPKIKTRKRTATTTKTTEEEINTG